MLPASDITLELEEAYKKASDALKAISGGGSLGRTPDAVRATDAWKSAKLSYDLAFAALRAHNAMRAKAI